MNCFSDVHYEESTLFGTKRLILASHQCSLQELFAVLCPDSRLAGIFWVFTGNMMN